MEKTKQANLCLGTVHALLITAEIAELSLQAQPFYRQSC